MYAAIGTFIGELVQDKPSLQMLTLFIIFIICVTYIYDKNKDKYVYISLIFVYLFSFMVLLINHGVFPLTVIYALIIPVILNIVGMMLAYKANAIQSENEDRDIDKDDVFKVKSLIITCFVMISLVIVLGTLEFPMKMIYLLVSLLYILSSFIVYYANRSFTKNKHATG